MRFTLTIVFIFLCLISSLAVAQTGNNTTNEWEDIILLKSGVSFRGIIFEQIPGKYYKIRLNDGTILDFEANLVDVVTRQPKVNFPPAEKDDPNKYAQIPTAPIRATTAPTLKKTWFTIGPSLNLGYTLFKIKEDAPIGFIYGMGISASYGTKVSEDMYILGIVSGDFNGNYTVYSSSNGNPVYSYASPFNMYSAGVGFSSRNLNYYFLGSAGVVFGEYWEPEHMDVYGYDAPKRYISSTHPYIDFGVLLPIIDNALALSMKTNVTTLFGSVNAMLRVGLVYTPN